MTTKAVANALSYLLEHESLVSIVFYVYTSLIAIQMIVRTNLGCRQIDLALATRTRSEIKRKSRSITAIFGSGILILTIFLMICFTSDTISNECQEDIRFKKLFKLTLAIVTFISTYGLYYLISSIKVCKKFQSSYVRRRKDPVELSSDEEDDWEFLR